MKFFLFGAVSRVILAISDLYDRLVQAQMTEQLAVESLVVESHARQQEAKQIERLTQAADAFDCTGIPYFDEEEFREERILWARILEVQSPEVDPLRGKLRPRQTDYG